MGSPSKSETIEDARERLRSKLDEGTRCPCCDQYAKRYQRKLNSSMAAALCWMWTTARQAIESSATDVWIDVPAQAPAWVLKAREYPKLAWWGLIEEKPRQPGSKGRTSGMWRVTQAGADFVRGGRPVAQYAYVYNGTVEDFSTHHTWIREALSNRFDYRELMGFQP
tara:strand:- start:206 stop:706 length:501 start_codon:yes stop_codon:yes gene_type:complete